MKCNADKGIKDCCNQNTCCEECGYEDCHEGCDIFDNRADGCCGCEYEFKSVYDGIISYKSDILAIYLHSWQGQNYTIEKIKELLNEDILKYI